MTRLIPLKSIPLAMISVHINTHISPFLNYSMIFSLSRWSFSLNNEAILIFLLYISFSKSLALFLDCMNINTGGTNSPSFLYQSGFYIYEMSDLNQFPLFIPSIYHFLFNGIQYIILPSYLYFHKVYSDWLNQLFYSLLNSSTEEYVLHVFIILDNLYYLLNLSDHPLPLIIE